MWSVELFDFMNSGLLTLLLGPDQEARRPLLLHGFVILILTSGTWYWCPLSNDISWVTPPASSRTSRGYPPALLSGPLVDTLQGTPLISRGYPSRVLSNLPWIPSQGYSLISRGYPPGVLSDLPLGSLQLPLGPLEVFLRESFRRRIERHNQRKHQSPRTPTKVLTQLRCGPFVFKVLYKFKVRAGTEKICCPSYA